MPKIVGKNSAMKALMSGVGEWVEKPFYAAPAATYVTRNDIIAGNGRVLKFYLF